MSENKPILSIETSESLCGACVYFGEKKFFETNLNLKNSHAEKLFEAIDFVMNQAGCTPADLHAIAVSSGPGSFTGLRIGMSAAKGIAFGAGLPVIPVPTFEAMALQLGECSADEEFIVANRVNMEEIYYAKFQVKANNYIFVESLQILTIKEFREKLNNCKLVFGNAAQKFAEDGELKKSGISAPRSLYVAKWSDMYGGELGTFDYDYLEPEYLKNFIIKGNKNA
jgi:tRNA threonylcarbamoyladenosine biosynthesis protein TsaB